MRTKLLITTIIFLIVSCSPYKNLIKMEFEDLEYPYETKKISLSNNITLAYVDEGNGDNTIIFIHGLGSYIPAWKKNITELKKHYRCIAIDLPGYGKSSKGLYSGSMEFYADVVSEFLTKLNIEKAVIAGHSMGGQIAMTLALKYPNIVEKLILVDPAGFEYFTDGQKDWFRDVMTVNLVNLTPANVVRENIYVNFYDMPEDAEFMVTDRLALRGAKDFDKYSYAVVRSVHGMVDEPVYSIMNRIKQPTLIVFGENDNLIPNRFLNPGTTKEIAEYGHSQIPNSELVLIKNCGHFAQFEKPEEFNNAVINFLK